MKRHPSLIPLSHDHHDTLVVAQGLIRGRPTAPRSDWPTDRRAQADRLTAFFENTLRSHFAAEEADVFPLAERLLPDHADLVNALRKDHADLRAEIVALPARSDADLAVRLPALGARLEAHVRSEERVLFEAVQKTASPDQLERLGAKLAHERQRTVACAAPDRGAAPPSTEARTPTGRRLR